MLAINIRATEALLGAAREVGAALVNAGSSSEYGYQDHAPGEDERVEPNSHYAVTKVAATHLCQLAAATSGMRAVTLRLYSIYGPWEEPGRLMPTLVRDAARAAGRRSSARRPPATSSGSRTRATPSCRPATVAICRIPARSSTSPAAARRRSRTLVSSRARVFGVSADPSWGSMPARVWDTSIWVGDPSRGRGVLGWRLALRLMTGSRASGVGFKTQSSVHPATTDLVS